MKVQELKNYKSLFATHPYKNVSKKYVFVPTSKILEIFENEGWEVSEVHETRPRNKDRIGYQKHLVRLRNISMSRKYKEEIPELILVNSHDKSSALQLKFGIFRFVCSNGLIIADYISNYRIIHINYNKDLIIKVIKETKEKMPVIMNKVLEMKKVKLSEKEQFEFAKKAIELRWNTEKYFVSVEEVLEPIREEDKGNELWKVLNRTQESIIRGGIKVVNKTTKKERLAKEIKSIDTQIKINEKLFNLAEKFIA